MIVLKGNADLLGMYFDVVEHRNDVEVITIGNRRLSSFGGYTMEWKLVEEPGFRPFWVPAHGTDSAEWNSIPGRIRMVMASVARD